MFRLVLPCFLLLAGAAAAAGVRGGPVAEACARVHVACRDGCAVDYGASLKHRPRLKRCAEACDRDESVCRERAFGGIPAKDQPRQPGDRELPGTPSPRGRAQAEPPATAPARNAPPMNVGAPDWLDDPAPARERRPAAASAPAPVAPMAPVPPVALTPREPRPAEGFPPAQPRAQAEALAPLETLAPLPPAGEDPPLDPLPPLDEARAPARSPSSTTLPSSDADWPAPSSPPPPAPSPAAPPPAPKKPVFKKPVDISDWDPNG